MSTQATERPVLKAISAIMADVGSVEKRGTNSFHNYAYATAADIAHALQKRMAAAGLIIIPHQRSLALIANESVLAIEFEFSVEHVSGDKLDHKPCFTGMASARNTKGGFDDKAANKCLTAATKYFTLNLFRIPTGDYPDSDGEADRADNGKDRAGPHSPDKTVTRDPNTDLSGMNGTAGTPKRLARNDYERLVDELRLCMTPDACKEWGKLRKSEIEKLPEDWVVHLQEEYQKHKDGLQARAA